jgi:hypothetical protein
VPRRTVSLDWRAGSPNQRTIPTARAAFEPLTTGIVATRVAAIAEAPKPDTNTQATASESQLHPNSHSPSSSLSASTGSGRSRIPVRRSIDPDVFATFGRS